MILLDTHTLLWWVSGSPKLSSKALSEILVSQKSGSIFVSSISIWEIAMLVKEGEITFNASFDEWISWLKQISGINFVPLESDILINSVFLSELNHKDAADRIIIATALSLGCPLITKDKKIRGYKRVKTIW